jgi:gluconokinase
LAVSDVHLVVMGVSGVGKTTVGMALAGALGWQYIEGDAFHPDANRRKMASGVALTDEDRWPWLDTLVEELDAGEGSAVLACSALKLRYRDRLRASRLPVRFVWLRGSEALISERLSERKDHYMPPSLLRSQLDALEPPLAAENVLCIGVDQPAEILMQSIIEELNLDDPENLCLVEGSWTVR